MKANKITVSIEIEVLSIESVGGLLTSLVSDINAGVVGGHVRMDDVAAVEPDIVASACPFCLTMLSDGIKETDREGQIDAYDVIELLRKHVKV